MPGFTRRDFIAAAAALPIAASARAQDAAPLITRAVPGDSRQLPAVGLGTAVLFNSNDEATRQKADAVTRALVAAGGRLIDTASTYGLAETVFGEIIAAAGLRNKLFIASKVEAPDADELKRSLTRLKVSQLDLLQLHNVHDPLQSLAQFREWKAQGLCRHIGITSTFRGDLPAIEAVLRREKPEFVQVDYSIDNREAESRVLPIAAETGAGVLTALPFGRGRLFRAVHGKELPDWAKPFAASWAQFFLKYLIGDPRVTAVIPGTGDAAHMTDNAGAMRGPLPDTAQRKQMAAFVDGL
ncbi:aldo/keto reductase [Bradyrhizobium sp. U87765 SZCCT0131]|uniref:aldo/keto reductase n=1 Tax=unclassified Bradyrhizobium TaxID=2631580 RepID=UPI001BA7E37E|nr:MULTISPECIES: aldo/keto reductase [unclassified Bradyrhizobium]MBR1221358.1 aldo/keto reductase [Bradyrhizobium sp. U87765 SZCCT0131]MBR1264719.1 aldo/keto reductase [Bradyrhizobium sp. U87765 SZCCT0134]MBR1304375.1 aldo/keto reductase [Bradyrhizobium sp. U87765 SZCCT0110]MBR1322768.1 aldo/keto reductase [Bradyrhizobium sp. U87765 SZCCT0109]MBR1346304.1 aldo/keto reductase [Bradyrhizobium sp. U87765 SZCCT0048]